MSNELLNNPIVTRVDDNILGQLEEYASQKKWSISQVVREIITTYFANMTKLSTEESA